MKENKQLTTLVRAAQGGDQSAFAKLYRATRDRAYFVALSITKNEDDALDILQDAYLKAWQRLSSLEDPEQFSAWFRAITGNTAKDYLRKQSPLLFTPLNGEESGPLDWLEEQGEDYLPAKSMDTAETRRLILDIVQKLPEDQRLCVLMHYYEDLPVADIAAALELPQGTVKSRLWYARQSISEGVRRLERTGGVKLYAAGPLPLAVWVLRHLKAPAARHLPRMILGGGAGAGTAAAGGATAAGGTAAGAATAGGAATGAVTAGSIAAGIALPKVIAGAVAVIVVAGGSAAGVKIAQQANEPPLIPPATAIVYEQETAVTESSFLYPMLPEGLAFTYTAQPVLLPDVQTTAAAESHPTAAATTVTATAATQAESTGQVTTQPGKTTAGPPSVITTTTAKATTAATVVTTTTTKTTATASTTTTRTTTSKTATAAGPLIQDPGLEASIRALIKKPTGELTSADLAGIKLFGNDYLNIRSLDGIKHCTSLEDFRLYWNSTVVQNADFSNMTSLQSITLMGNEGVTNINLSGCTSLEVIRCTNTNIISLDVRGCTALKEISIDSDTNIGLASMNVRDCVALEFLHISKSSLTSLNVSGLTNLRVLNCGENTLNTLNIRGLTSLQDFNCSYNNLSSLDISGLTSLQEFRCSNNNLTSLDVRGLTNLRTVYCDTNRFPSQAAIIGLDLLPNLQRLYFSPQKS